MTRTHRESSGKADTRTLDLSDEDAAPALVNPVTAWVMTMVEHDLKPGAWLVQAAAGSTVGQLALQLAHSERFRTVNIVRRRA